MPAHSVHYVLNTLPFMTITLTYRNLMMLGLNGTLEKDGITLED